jgi:exopolysaccharide/PEP-CTERM locus tyrosine autokinase
MPESIGLIERAAALLRQRDPNESDPLIPSAGGADGTGGADGSGAGGPELVLDRGRLASYGITMPSSARSRTVEELRLVKRNLMTQLSQGSPIADQRSSRLIMVTSARPGEGKTFISLNLALAFASERDVKALLVDVDTQHSSLQKILGITTELGIVDVLAGNRELSEVLIQTNIPNLMVLPSGRGGPHVPELFSSNQMAILMAEMTRRFADRYIIIDTPPCMASSDAAALAPLVGQIVFIVEAHHTQQVEIEASLSMLGGCPRISLLLNKSDTMAGEHFGSYEYYYHSQGHESDVLRSGKPA